MLFRSVIEIPHEQVRDQKELADAEREIIRLMLRYGQETLVEVDEITGEIGVTVADYIIRELCMDELDFQQPLLRRMFEEYKQLVYSGAIVSEIYFTQHADPEISRLAAGFEPKYELSNIHRRNGVTVKTEENNLHEVVPASILAYKNKRVLMRLKEVAFAMQQAEINNDDSQLEALYAQYNNLSQVKKTLGLTLGKRIYN